MSKWKVRLTGDNFDLEDLPRWFNEGDIKIKSDEGKYFLYSETFENLSDVSKVRDEAKRIEKIINSIGRIYRNNFQPIEIGAVYLKDKSGKEVINIRSEAKVGIRDKASITIIDKNGKVKKETFPFQGEKLNKLIQSDLQVQIVFDYLSKPVINWNDLYCILDAIEEDIGKPVWKNNWASRNSVELFTRTACSYEAIGVKARHAKSKIQPPEKPMRDQEASHLILKIVKQWLEYKLS